MKEFCLFDYEILEGKLRKVEGEHKVFFYSLVNSLVIILLTYIVLFAIKSSRQLKYLCLKNILSISAQC